MNVLVADDSTLTRTALRKKLAGLGHTVHEADSARRAAELARQHAFDIAITDWVLPDAEGPEICRALRAATAPRPIYVFLRTARTDVSVQAARLAGADDLMRKSFEVTDLAAQLDAAGRALKPSPSRGDAASRERPVLVVDDSPVARKVATALLRRLGYRCHEADDGSTALGMIEQEQYGLVLMDCQMPGLDGFEATRTLRARGCATPVVAVTATLDAADVEVIRACGMDDMLCKPPTLDILAAKLEEWYGARA